MKMSKTYKGLVLEGAGARGILFSGAMKGMERHGVVDEIEHVVGTSAGSIVALLIALDYSSDEIRKIVSDLKTSDILKRDFFFMLSDIITLDNGMWNKLKDILRLPVGLLRVIANLGHFFFKSYGYYDQKPLLSFLRKTLKEKGIDPDISFKDIAEHSGYRNLYVTTTNIEKKTVQMFTAKDTPDVCVVDAVVASCSIPVFFRTMNYEKELYVDGGIIANFNINYLSDSNLCEEKEILGLRIDTTDEIKGQLQGNFFGKKKKIRGIKSLIMNMIEMMYAGANTPNIRDKGEQDVIFLNDRGAGVIDFSMTKEKKNYLVDGGLEDFLTQYLDAE